MKFIFVFAFVLSSTIGFAQPEKNPCTSLFKKLTSMHAHNGRSVASADALTEGEKEIADMIRVIIGKEKDKETLRHQATFLLDALMGNEYLDVDLLKAFKDSPCVFTPRKK